MSVFDINLGEVFANPAVKPGDGRRSGVNRPDDPGLFLWSTFYGSVESIRRERWDKVVIFACVLLVFYRTNIHSETLSNFPNKEYL